MPRRRKGDGAALQDGRAAEKFGAGSDDLLDDGAEPTRLSEEKGAEEFGRLVGHPHRDARRVAVGL